MASDDESQPERSESMADSPESVPGYVRVAIAGTLAFSILLRFALLDADPHYYEWLGYIADEGRWVEQARRLALGGDLLVEGGRNLHFVLAPLFQLVNYAIFEIAGISRVTTRILSALCGSLILAVFWFRFRRSLTSHALLLALVLLGLQVDLIFLSRVAIPEICVVFFELLVYLMLVSRLERFWQRFAAGLLMCVSIGFKATGAPVVGIFALVLLFLPALDRSREVVGHNLRGMLGFVAPMVVGGVGVLIVYIVGSGDLAFDHVGETLRGKIRFREWFSIVSFFFTHPIAPIINFLSLGLWLSLLLRSITAREDRSPMIDRLMVSSAIWAVAYLGVAMVLGYFPSRYKIHVVVPMVLHLAVAASLLQAIGFAGVADRIARAAGPGSWLRVFVLAGPTGVLAAPLIAHVLSLVGIEGDRISHKLLAIALGAGIVTAAAGFSRSRSFYATLTAFPLLGGLVWMATSGSGIFEGSVWPDPQQASLMGWYLLGQLLAIAVAFILVRRREGLRVGHTLLVVAGLYAIVALPRILPGYLDPHHTLRDISREFEAIAPPGAEFATLDAAGFFNDNQLSHITDNLENLDKAGRLPAFISAAPGVNFGLGINHTLLDNEYELFRTFEVYVSPEFYRLHPRYQRSSPLGEEILLYRRLPQGEAQASPRRQSERIQ